MRPAVMMVILLSTGSAEARTAFVDLSPEVLEALDLQSRKLEPVDIAKERARLQGMMGSLLETSVMPDEPPPVWAGPALKKDWEDGTAGCRAEAGPGPYPGNPRAIFCAQALGEALWQRHLERIDPTGVVLAGGYHRNSTTNLFEVWVLGYRVDEPRTRHLSAKEKTAKDALARTVELIGRIIDGQGDTTPRKLVRTIVRPPTGPDGAAPPLLAAQFKPVPVPAGCEEKLPRRLLLGSDQASVDLDRLWTVSVPGGKAPERTCTLTYHPEAGEVAGGMAGVRVYIAQGRLECGEDRFGAKKTQFQPSHVEEQVLKGILDQAVKAWCK